LPPLFLFVVPILKVFWPDFVKSDRLGWFNFFLFLRLIFWGRSEGLLFSSFTHARNDWGWLRFNFLFLWLWRYWRFFFLYLWRFDLFVH